VDQHEVALMIEEVTGGQVADQGLVDLGRVEVELFCNPAGDCAAICREGSSLASGSLAMVIWYLIERACFSLISAVSRSPPPGSMALPCACRAMDNLLWLVLAL
jgi:hypothetical protein